MKAAECGNLDICIDLLRAGSDPFLEDNYGRNAQNVATVCHPQSSISNMLAQYMTEI